MRLHHIPRIIALALVLALLTGGYSLMAGETVVKCVPGPCPDNMKCVPCPTPPSDCCATMGKTDGTSTGLTMAKGADSPNMVKPAVAGKAGTVKAVKASSTVGCKPSADCAPSPGCCAGATRAASKTIGAGAKAVQGEA
jgi:hypothetical protein